MDEHSAMNEHSPQYITPEYGVDDPIAHLRLPQVAQISNFWKRYDRLADIHDRKLTSNLNENLDVLLIFAALFSAINTSFISITMPNLSPNPSEQTNNLLRLIVTRADNTTLGSIDLYPSFSPGSNAIIVNCLLYASLSCSLLAAVGAMMAKEWLQSFDRTGQTGPAEEQGRFRQRKFMGVEQWHLEAVVKFLPNLLLLSVILFLIGIGIFLVPINTIVASTVIAFSGLGLVFSSMTIVAGAISPMCPYQSATASALRRAGRALLSIERTVERSTSHLMDETRTLVWKGFEMIHHIWVQLIRLARVSSNDQAANEPSEPLRLQASPGEDEEDPSDTNHASFSAQPEARFLGSQYLWNVRQFSITFLGRALPYIFAESSTKEASEQVVAAKAACWLLATTSNPGDQVITANFIPTVPRDAWTLALQGSNEVWSRLVSLTLQAVEVWRSQASDQNQELAETFGQALCHSIFALGQKTIEESLRSHDIATPSSRSTLGETFLRALKLAGAAYSTSDPEDEESIFHIAFLSSLLLILPTPAFQKYNCVTVTKLLSTWKNSQIADTLLGLWALAIAHNILGSIYGALSLNLEEMVNAGENPTRLAEFLSIAIFITPQVLEMAHEDPQSEAWISQAYIVCLRRAREISLHSTQEALDKMATGVISLSTRFLEPLTASDPGDGSRPDLLKLCREALLGLRAYIEDDSGPDRLAIVTAPLPETTQLLDSSLINAVTDMIIGDCEFRGDWMGQLKGHRSRLIRELMWVWKSASAIQADQLDMDEIFSSSCRLWSPLAREADYSLFGEYEEGEDPTPLKFNDLDRILECIELIKKHRESHEFICRGADIGITSLFAYAGREVDWEYRLFDFREQNTLCCRSTYIENVLL